MKFSDQLVKRIQEYFKQRFKEELDEESAQKILATLAELGNLFAKNADKLLAQRKQEVMKNDKQ